MTCGLEIREEEWEDGEESQTSEAACKRRADRLEGKGKMRGKQERRRNRGGGRITDEFP